MTRLIWTEQAEFDVVALIERADADGRSELVDKILEAPTVLLDHPALGRKVSGTGHRKWLVKETPFLLLYRVIAGRIEITRVLHRTSDWANIR